MGVLLVVSGMLLAIPGSGQIGGTGSIRGVVSDPSGAVVPAASVVATNVATQVKTARETTDAGDYSISPLPAGEYTVTVTAAGFQTINQEHIMVDALSMVGLNLTLKVGASSEQITVVDTPPQLNTVDARVGETVRNDVYMALPLFMGNAPRDPTAFASLMPGVPTNSGTYSFGDISGAQGNSGEMYLEGMPISNPAIQGEVRNVSLGVSAEAVEQFQLETAGSPVMYGGQGAANFVLKSGTNHFHGSVYEYFRNTDLDARNFFAVSRPAEHQNEFGENVGGPIKKNRIFFFQSYDGFRYITGSSPAYYTLPPMAERTGDFSGYPALIYDPQSLDCSKGPCTRTAFVGNIIPTSRISAISKVLQAPLPATSNSNVTNNFLYSNAYGFNSYSTTQKVDLNLTDKQRLFGLYSRGHRNQANEYRGGTLPDPYDSGSSALQVDEITTTAQARHTYVVTPTILNQLSYSFARFFQPQTGNTASGNWPIKAGMKGLPAGGASTEFPSVSFSGSNSPTTWSKNHPVYEVDQSFNLQDNVQWTKGKHSITIGLQIAWTQINYANNRFGSQANWTFSNAQTEGFNSAGTAVTTTGNAYASYLLGALSSASLQDDATSETGGRYRNYTEWFQDNFRVSSKLTLNIGFRYDIMTPYTEVANRLSFFNPTVANTAASGYPGILMFAGNGPDSCNCSTNIATYHGMIQPRIGLAYSLNSKTVFRAGYDMTYTHRGAVGGRGGGRQGTGILGFSAQPSWNSLDTYSPAFYWDAGVPSYIHAPFYDPTLNTGYTTTVANGSSVSYGDPQIGGHPPRYQNWSVGLQHAFTNTFTLTVNYVASNGHFLGGGSRSAWGNQIQPKYMKLGNLLTSKASATTIAQAAAIFPEIHLPYANYAGSIAQMLQQFPQYSSVSDVFGEVGNSNYNSLQVTAAKRLSYGLTFNANYTFQKTFDDLGTRSSWWSEKAQSGDSPQMVNATVVYNLPFGKGQMFSGNPILNKVAGGWQISGITTFREGGGWGSIGGSCNLPSAGSCYVDMNPNFTGPVRIGGNPADANLKASTPPVFLDKNVFLNPAAYTYGTSPRSMVDKLRNVNSFNESLSLKREFRLMESKSLVFQADVSNPTNFVIFGNPSTSFTSTSWGTITSQGNGPRYVQLSARVKF